jgi:ATP/maltotriose-dependent transcriptional regulator MalT
MPPGVSAAAAPGFVRWPLVGRGDELEQVGDALADGAMRGVLIQGPAGVGKTRLADECFEFATRGGRAGGRATATGIAGGLSLGALMPLLPLEIVDRRLDPLALYAIVAAALREQAGANGPFVLLVDDLHLLDAASVVLLGQLLDAGVVFLIGTLRTGEQSSERAAELWRRDHLLRVDLRDLRREEVDTLLYLALGGAVEAAAIEAVWNASRGNVLYVRELVLGARAAGRLVERQGVWRLTGTLLGTTRLTELVERRLAAAPGDASELLATLAVWEPIGLAELERVSGGETLEALENSGLLRVRLDGRRQEVSLAHPLYGEVIRARLTALMRRRVLIEHADRIEGRGARRREDPLRVATARLDAEGSADPRLLLTAARLARYGHDYPQVQRLARAALVGERTPEALLLLSEALHELGAYAEVEDLLASATDVTKVDEALWVPLVAMRVRNLVWGLQRTAEALGVNRAALDRVDDPAAREELTVDEAMVLTFSGRPVEALDVIRGISGTTSRTVVLRSIAEAPALILTGRCETALQISKRAQREHEALEEQLAIAHPGVHVVHQMYALIEAGRLKQAWRLATTAYEVSSGIAVPLGRMWFAYGLGRIALLMGRPQTARRWLAEAAGLCEDAGYDGPHRIVLSLLAMCDANRGDEASATAAADELDRLPPFAYRAPEQQFGRAWALVASGDMRRAREVLAAAAGDAAESGHRALEAWLLHDMARLGDPASVWKRLRQLAAECEGALVPAYAAHSHAAAGRSPTGLRDAAAAFTHIGANLLAAEAAAAAAQAHQKRGEGREATAIATEAGRLAQLCEGARTPALVSAAAPEPLTAREREVASLAAQRLTSKEIADRLYLSVRTVDNHLQKIYTKLGVTSRVDLAAALDDGGDDDPRRSPP